jgi:hypothetical protein
MYGSSVPSGPPPVSASGGVPRSWPRRALAYLRAHPILCLALLTPGIPEYLSGSSSFGVFFANPVLFLILLGANLGMYLPGVLLIREAMIRWRKGWASVIVLGAAYGIAEEGLGLSTLFNAHAGVVGALGSYGHWLGVNWVWSVGVLMVHIVYSLALPILLLGLALPETRGRSLLGARGIAVALGVFVLDLFFLMLVVLGALHFWMGIPQLLGSLLAIGALILVARRLPVNLLGASSLRPTVRPLGFLLLGLGLFPVTLVLEGVSGAVSLAPPFAILLVLAWFALLLYLAGRWIGQAEHERHLLAFAAGTLAPIALVGFLTSFPTPVVLLADLALGGFFWRLWTRSRLALAETSASLPPGVYGAPPSA